ncbi:MAG: zinc ribbon domain-containing protein [Candidatus Micrarchaeota archaeon]
MGIIDESVGNIFGRVKSDLSYRAGSEISSGVEKTLRGGLNRGNTGEAKKLDKCPKCSVKISEPDLKFCPSCGQKLVATCEKCTRDFPFGTKFCTQCGGELDRKVEEGKPKKSKKEPSK